MRYIDKLCNFFLSYYSNNSKFHHSKLGNLRVLFERNTKLKATFSSLGNVFRNSKWSDLKIQNIKPSFTRSWSSTAGVLALLFFLTSSFFGFSTSVSILHQLPFFTEIYELIAYTWAGVNDWFRVLIASIGSLSFRYFAGVLPTVVGNDRHIYNSLTPTQPSTLGTSFVLGKATLHSSETSHWLNSLTHARVRLDLSLGRTLPLHLRSTSKMSSLESLSIFSAAQAHDSRLFLSTLESNWLLVPTSTLREFNFDSRLGYNLVDMSKPAINTLVTLNSLSTLQISKEDRWLMRNSLLSDSLSVNSNAFTQSKKLLGINTLSAGSNDKNVWASTKLNATSNERALDFISHLQELFNNKTLVNNQLNLSNHFNSTLVNFNSFEHSRMWLTKKYAFTEQLQSNLTLPSTSTSTTNFRNPQLEYLEPSTTLFFLGPKTQINYLSLTLIGAQDFSTECFKGVPNFHVTAGGSMGFKSNNMVFLNKLTHSTPLINLPYFNDFNDVGYTLPVLSQIGFRR